MQNSATDPRSESATSRLLSYEQPLNERVRTFLRLEYLFERMQHHSSGTKTWDSRAAIDSLLEILAILTRGDIRSEVMKEMERQNAVLSRLKDRPNIDAVRLSNVITSLKVLLDKLDAPDKQLGKDLRENEFLSSIRHRSSIPGGTCGFDLPILQYWLNQAPEIRQKKLQNWLDELEPLRRGVALSLMLTRESATPTKELAAEGMYQQSLDTSGCQLVRIQVSPELRVFPEISGGKHRFTIRFLESASADVRPRQTSRDIPFQLICCQL